MKKELESLYYRAPQELVHKLLKMPFQEPRRNTSFIWLKTAAATLAILTVGIFARQWSGPSPDEVISTEVVSNHVRSMMANHLIDVVSSDRHTVKPWFNGKLDFSPKVLDLSADGFPLAGGRLEYLDSRPIAALVYHRNQHVINVLTWPTSDAPSKMVLSSRQGYSLFHWKSGGMQYWIISDLNVNELKGFAEMIEGRQ